VADKKEKEKDKKPNAFQKWFRETLGELRKVSWPSLKDAWRLTRIVLVVLVAMGAVLGLLDYIFSQLVSLLLA
jgi:preprotein translocase subunit SecE